MLIAAYTHVVSMTTMQSPPPGWSEELVIEVWNTADDITDVCKRAGLDLIQFFPDAGRDEMSLTAKTVGCLCCVCVCSMCGVCLWCGVVWCGVCVMCAHARVCGMSVCSLLGRGRGRDFINR